MATEEAIVPVDPAPEGAVPEVVEGGGGAAAGGKVEKLKKAKKPAGLRKPPSHPSYLEMITDAIVTLKEKGGSSVLAIAKFNEEKHKQLPLNFRKLLFFHLKKLAAAQKLVKVKNSFKLPAATSRTVAPPKSAATLKGKKPAKSKAAVKPKPKPAAKLKKETKVKPAAAKPKSVAAGPKPKAAAATAKTKATLAVKPKAAATKAKPKSAPAAKPKAAAAKAKAAPRPKPKERPAKVARTTTRSSPGKKAVTASKKAAPAAKKAAPTKAKAAAKSPTRKASTRRAKK